MIAIFVLLGLGLLGGGAAAIYDGMPYLVLERGFTQVIIGAIAATAGVIMLALARVLVEVRRIKATLANATMALSVASMSGAAPQAAAPAAQASVPGAAQATAGGIAAAGAAIAATSAFEPAPSQDEAPPEAGREPAADPADASHDLFGELASGSQAQEAASGSPSVDVETLPAFDPFRPVDPQGGPAAAPVLAGDESEVAEEAAVATTAEAADESVSPEMGAEEAPIQPEIDVPPPSQPAAEPERADARSGADEFSVLRESLAGRLRELDLAETRTDPPFAPAAGPEPDPLDSAEAWMHPASSRREPWFDEPAVAEPPPAGSSDDLPPWPPQTREAAAVADEPEEPGEPEESAGGDEGQDAEGAQAAAAEAPETGEKPPVAEPAASEEGVVGAYQVGNAHFTIYADGSIQARTPEGDYSFASMDELKVYLASEKNRLGV